MGVGAGGRAQVKGQRRVGARPRLESAVRRVGGAYEAQDLAEGKRRKKRRKDQRGFNETKRSVQTKRTKTWRAKQAHTKTTIFFRSGAERFFSFSFLGSRLASHHPGPQKRCARGVAAQKGRQQPAQRRRRRRRIAHPAPACAACVAGVFWLRGGWVGKQEVGPRQHCGAGARVCHGPSHEGAPKEQPAAACLQRGCRKPRSGRTFFGEWKLSGFVLWDAAPCRERERANATRNTQHKLT